MTVPSSSHAHAMTLVCALQLLGSPAAQGQVLDLPPRAPGATGGAEIALALRDLDLDAREELVFTEVAAGNIPSWLRTLQPVHLTTRLRGEEHRVSFWATADYLAVGSNDDYFLVPLSPQTAQRIADLVGGTLPTPLMVDAIWESATVRLPPTPIPPTPAMTTVRVFAEHDRMVRAQRRSEDAPMGALVAGDKKDVVLTPRLDSSRGKVAIYGWHRLDGEAIQPLYLGHTDRWVDYSHGTRLVSRDILVDGEEVDLLDVLANEELAGLLSDEGPVQRARYSLVRSPGPG